MEKSRLILIVFFLLGFAFNATAAADKTLSAAVVDFDTAELKGFDQPMDQGFADLLSAELSGFPEFQLVDRTMLKKLFDEQALHAGFGIESTPLLTGRLTGADVLIFGRALSMNRRLMITARIVGVNTGALQIVNETGESGAWQELLKKLALKIQEVLLKKKQEYLPQMTGSSDLRASLVRAVAGKKLPVVFIHTKEKLLEVSDGPRVSENELSSLMLSLNFEVRKSAEDISLSLNQSAPEAAALLPKNLADVQVLIQGESSAVLGLRTGDLVSAKAQVHLRAIDVKRIRVIADVVKDGEGVNTTPKEASVEALLNTTRQAAATFIPKVVDAWNEAS